MMTLVSKSKSAVVAALKEDAAMQHLRPYRLKILTDKDRRQLALDIVEGRVYGSWMMRNLARELVSTFIVLLFADRLPEHVGEIYEYYKEAGPLAVNGRPMFYSCRFLAKEDTGPVHEYVQLLQAQRKAFTDSTDDSKP